MPFPCQCPKKGGFWLTLLWHFSARVTRVKQSIHCKAENRAKAIKRAEICKTSKTFRREGRRLLTFFAGGMCVHGVRKWSRVPQRSFKAHTSYFSLFPLSLSSTVNNSNKMQILALPAASRNVEFMTIQLYKQWNANMAKFRSIRLIFCRVITVHELLRLSLSSDIHKKYRVREKTTSNADFVGIWTTVNCPRRIRWESAWTTWSTSSLRPSRSRDCPRRTRAGTPAWRATRPLQSRTRLISESAVSHSTFLIKPNFFVT